MNRIALSIALVGVLALGCNRTGNGKSPFNFVGFVGSLRYSDGKPVKNVRVKLVPFENAEGHEGLEAEGATDESGNFTPATGDVGKVYYGRYKIVIEPLKEEGEPGASSPVPPRYRSVETTDRRIDVTKNGLRTVVIMIDRE